MPSPNASNHHAARDAAITVIRDYQPDPTRCVEALLIVLGSTPPKAQAGGGDGAADDRPAVEVVAQEGTNSDRQS